MPRCDINTQYTVSVRFTAAIHTFCILFVRVLEEKNEEDRCAVKAGCQVRCCQQGDTHHQLFWSPGMRFDEQFNPSSLQRVK